ncbi:MAG: divergent polysaccharide deacetylase family protein, partial [Cypionkella sp.]
PVEPAPVVPPVVPEPAPGVVTPEVPLEAAAPIEPVQPEVASEAPNEMAAPASGEAPALQSMADPAMSAAAPLALPEAAGSDAAPSADLAPAMPEVPLAEVPAEPPVAEVPSGVDQPAAEAPAAESAEPAAPAVRPSDETTEALLTPPPMPQAPPPAEIVLDPPVLPEIIPPAIIPPAIIPEVIVPPETATLPPTPGLPKSVDGVTINRLPSIGTPPAAEIAAAAEPVPDAMPLIRFARAFKNESGKPLFAVVLQDTGGSDLDRAQLAALPFPVSFVIDPLDPSAADAATIYRAGGQEVVMLASGFPEGANAGDLEQSFQANEAVLPEAVAVMDIGAGGFQDNRPLAAQVVPLIKDMGRGLLTFDQGLNAADQEARRDGVPSARIFRELDARGEDTPLIRRYLDRAAFKAAQEGRVVVLGSTRPETIAALMAWAVEGRGTSVSLAPISALMQAK